MTIEIRFPNQDESDQTTWHFQLIGEHTADGTIRIARTSQTLAADEDPSDWLAANGVVAQALVDAGEINQVVTDRYNFRDLKQKAASELDYLNTTIPLIDTMTAAQVRSVVKRLAQENRQIIRALKYVFRVVKS